MKLPAGFGDLDFSEWVRSLLAAFIGGGAGGFAGGIVVTVKDPEHYAMWSWNFFQVVGSVFLVSGFMNAMAFLRTKPLPEVKHVTTTVRTTEMVFPATKVETIIQEKHVESINPEDKCS